MAIKSFVTVWTILAKNNLQNQFLSSSASILFILGKLFNYSFSIIIVYSIFGQVSTLNSYTLPQAIIMVLLFNFIDSFTQFFFRALYQFRPILLKGDFDLDLLKPLPSYFRPIFSAPDFLDFPILIIQITALVYFLINFHLVPSLITFCLFVFIFLNGVAVAFAIHLIIAAISVLSTEVDSLVMIYRNLGRAAIIPTDSYRGIFSFFLNFIVPITVIFTLPAKAMLNIITPLGILYSSVFAIGFFVFALWLWNFSLKHYTSASS